MKKQTNKKTQPTRIYRTDVEKLKKVPGNTSAEKLNRLLTRAGFGSEAAPEDKA